MGSEMCIRDSTRGIQYQVAIKPPELILVKIGKTSQVLLTSVLVVPDVSVWAAPGASPSRFPAIVRMVMAPPWPNFDPCGYPPLGGSLPMPSAPAPVGSPPVGTSDTGLRPPPWVPTQLTAEPYQCLLMELTAARFHPSPRMTSQAPSLGTMGP